jgi:pectinesterase inhibitor-like protein
LKQINSLVKKERLITEGCSQTLDKELCKCTVDFFLENKGLGLRGMAKLAVENALKYGTKIHNHISKLLKTTLDINIQKSLKSCSVFYMSATNKIKDSLPALDSKRYSDASTWVGAATDWAETCEDIFAGKSHLTSMKNEFEKLVSIALAVIKKMSPRGVVCWQRT